jgi:hypothetical protein
MVFRTSPQLGPELEMKAQKFHWDGDNVDVSYRLGNKEVGSDGHNYILVQAAGTLAANATVTINETTWVATAGAGGYTVPAGLTGGVVAGDYFHARVTAL